MQMSEKDEDKRLSKVIKACKIISSILPDDSLNHTIKASMTEILPKMIHLCSDLPQTVTPFNPID